ncbi:hypothetical protein C8246_20815 [Paracidovorax avenae]|uniref:FRG domain-containing protein n=1 Tax=Paracidovorax avenae TaxID=80867 RepID=UPI000D1623B9|nr:FRG domain-containing protein [Paracidovorax avenae]AVS93785.1 hypothetical protein C8246_20815 [Paracidovorax avenae]AVS99965.1 hypothetical protein C8236_14870 [Paracidovorax avenae]AVT06909.1 hypothetical protein C8248_13765 [Paracidovorax avenae]AVT21390.1 hypothetical protein C7Y68_16460 [Paracidovorax avenae]
MTQTIASLEGYVRKIRSVTPANDEVLLYRGHSNRRAYKLIPSLLREDKYEKAEHRILRELVASHPSEFSTDATTLEQLVRVQHYSLPTRLLDLTWNPLVGLYFATTDGDGPPAEVIVFRVKKSLVKFYDSDTASCIANLAHLSSAEKQAIDFRLNSDDFNKQEPIDRLLQFIRAEKSHFLGKIKPDDLKSAIVVKPKLNNRRILSQSGAFLLCGLSLDLEAQLPAGIMIERININGNRKSTIRSELDRMAINDSSMFPEIEKAALYIKGKL